MKINPAPPTLKFNPEDGRIEIGRKAIALWLKTEERSGQLADLSFDIVSKYPEEAFGEDYRILLSYNYDPIQGRSVRDTRFPLYALEFVSDNPNIPQLAVSFWTEKKFPCWHSIWSGSQGLFFDEETNLYSASLGLQLHVPKFKQVSP